ncbi:hypothetical protein NDU88_005002 [Pleurodeles waltl]|uniref:Uncharacterized protein n=1 Tax=Pleurodeles waltl TaxID=8319 RepID=A0AAV7UGY2_PLEWA|nr:hypothetical protein NDU88_005002 [Pleurodeles waltl]
MKARRLVIRKGRDWVNEKVLEPKERGLRESQRDSKASSPWAQGAFSQNGSPCEEGGGSGPRARANAGRAWDTESHLHTESKEEDPLTSPEVEEFAGASDEDHEREQNRANGPCTAATLGHRKKQQAAQIGETQVQYESCKKHSTNIHNGNIANCATQVGVVNSKQQDRPRQQGTTMLSTVRPAHGSGGWVSGHSKYRPQHLL